MDRDTKKILDRYLMTEPTDYFQEWAEWVIDRYITQETYQKHEDFLCASSDLWLNRLYKSGKTAEEAGKIIERACKLYLS